MVRIPQPQKYQLSDIQKRLKIDAKEIFEQDNEDYHKYMKQVAEIIANDDKNKIVLLSGPSGSGKTTSAHLIAYYLEKIGMGTVTVSFDDFYLSRDDIPRLADGRIDFESVEALDVPIVKECMMGLIKNGYCEMPRFDFNIGKPDEKRYPLRLEENQIAIFEGIHALNPVITDELPRQNLCKLYISVRDGFFEKKRLIFSPREVRLMRRMIRDSKFRNSDARNTLSMWTGVVMGEDKYIYPYKHSADVHVNSLHSFEPFVYKNELVELLKDITENDENYKLGAELLTDLQGIEAISYNDLPEDSLIREFVGNN